MMDYQKKKMLTQSVALIQSHLTLTSDTLEVFKAADVLTSEEVSTIEKDEMSSGKVVELVCLLKRKDNRTFGRFLQALEDMHMTNLVELFKSKASVSDVMKPDPQTLHYLEHELNATSLHPRKVKEMAVNLVMRNIYEDDKRHLLEQVGYLQRQLKARNLGPPEFMRQSYNSESSDSGTTTPLQPSSANSRTNSGDHKSKSYASQHGELVTLLKQKDHIIRKKDEEYGKLRRILEETQNDLHSVLELNNQYLTIISQLNQLQMTGVTPRNMETTQAIMDLEKQLEESQSHIKELQVELGGVSEELHVTEKELERVLGRERKYKELLDLDPDASNELVEERLAQLKKEGSLHRNELDRIRRELEHSSRQRIELETAVTSLTRDKEKIEFHMRQQELTIKKMKRMRTASNTIQQAESTLAAHSGNTVPTHLRLPSIDRPGSQISLSNRTRSHQYCMFCRQEYQPLKNNGCRAHFRPIRNGKWTCCSDDCHRSIGCLQIPHFYMEITVDKKIFITDGARYMEIS